MACLSRYPGCPVCPDGSDNHDDHDDNDDHDDHDGHHYDDDHDHDDPDDHDVPGDHDDHLDHYVHRNGKVVGGYLTNCARIAASITLFDNHYSLTHLCRYKATRAAKRYRQRWR